MRPIERIDDFVRKVNWSKLSKDWGLIYPILYLNRKARTYWKQNPDQQIGQVLINLGMAPNKMTIWSAEEADILINQGVPPEECLYWTSMYDANENLLEEPITRLVSTLTPEHINKIYEFMNMHGGRISSAMNTAFENVLERENNKRSHDSTPLHEETSSSAA